jgi:hypothetical protein
MPREMADREKAEDVESLLQWECERGHFRTRISDFVKQALIIGTSIAKVFWDFTTPEIRQRRIETEHIAAPGLEGGTQPLNYETANFVPDNALQGPRIKTVFRDQFLVPDLSCPGIQADDGQPYVIEVFDVSEPELRAMAKRGVYHKAAVNKVRKGGGKNAAEVSPDIDTELAQARAEAMGYGTLQHTNKEVERFRLEEMWGEFDLHGKGEMVECVITRSGDQVLRIQRNPFDHQRRPYVADRWINVPNEFDGIGVVEPSLSLWHERCDTRNQAMDFKSYTLNPMLIVGAAANVSDTRFVSGPGRIWQVMNPDAVKPMEFSTAAASLAMNMDAQIRNDIEDATGATRLLGGTDPGTIEKATVYTGMVEQANARILESMEALAHDAVTPALQMFWKLEQQFRNQAVVIRVLGKEGANLQLKTLERHDLMGDFDFLPVTGARLSARWQENQLLQQFIQIAGQFLQPDVRIKIIERIWGAMGLNDGTVIFPETGFIEVMEPGEETMLLMTGNLLPAHPLENHQQHLTVHASARQHAMQQGVDTTFLDAHIQEHLRAAGAQAQAPQQPYAQSGNPGATGQAPAPTPGSSIAGGQGDVMGKQGAEMFAGAAQ